MSSGRNSDEYIIRDGDENPAPPVKVGSNAGINESLLDPDDNDEKKPSNEFSSSKNKVKHYETIELTQYSNFAAPSNPKKESWTLSNFIPKLLFGNAINRAYVNRNFNNAIAWACGTLAPVIDLPPQIEKSNYFDHQENISDDDFEEKPSCKEKCGSCCGTCISKVSVGFVSLAVNIPGAFLTWNSIDKKNNLESISKSFVDWISGKSAQSWWSYTSTTNQQRYELIVKFSSFLSVNTLLNMLYFPEAIAKAKASIEELHYVLNATEAGKRKYSPQYRAWKATKLIMSTLLGIAGSISAAGMSYMSLAWTGSLVYVSMAISAISYLLIRFVGMMNTLSLGERIYWFFQKNIKTLLNILDRLKYADLDTQKELEKTLRELTKQYETENSNKSKKQIKELTEAAFEALTTDFFEEIFNRLNTNILESESIDGENDTLNQKNLNLSSEKPTHDSIKEYTFMFISSTIATYFAYEVSPIFGQTTINGLNGFAKLLGYTNGLESWGRSGRLVPGIIGIIPNFSTYLDAIRKLPYTCANTFWRVEETISENGILSKAFVKEAWLLGLLGYFNYYAGFGLAGTATSVEGHPNDFGLKLGANGIVITTACGIAAASVNVNSNLNRLEHFLKKKENITLLHQFIVRWEEYERRQPNQDMIEKMESFLNILENDSSKKLNIANNRNGFFANCCEPEPERQPLVNQQCDSDATYSIV